MIVNDIGQHIITSNLCLCDNRSCKAMTMCGVVLGAGVSVTANYTISSRTGSTIAAAPPSSTHYTRPVGGV